MGDITGIIEKALNQFLTYINNNKEWIFSGVGNVIVFSIIGYCFYKIIKMVIYRLRFKLMAKGSLEQILFSKQEKRNGAYLDSQLSKVLNIKKLLKDNYPEYTDFLIVQYGSSVIAQKGEPNDYDFIILLLGHPKEHLKEITSIGNYPEMKNAPKIEIDIVFRDYTSFLFAACSGMPYENSVIYKSKLIHGHRGHYEWLKRLSKNILMDRDFLIRQYKDKLISERNVFDKSINYGNHFEVVRAGYFYVTSLLQRAFFEKMGKVITQKDVVQLADIYYLGTFFKEETVIEVYQRLIRYLKRKDIPTDKKYLEADLKILIDYIFDNTSR